MYISDRSSVGARLIFSDDASESGTGSDKRVLKAKTTSKNVFFFMLQDVLQVQNLKQM